MYLYGKDKIRIYENSKVAVLHSAGICCVADTYTACKNTDGFAEWYSTNIYPFL